MIKGANLYICGFPKSMTQPELDELFQQCGNIITSRILYDNSTGILTCSFTIAIVATLHYCSSSSILPPKFVCFLICLSLDCSLY